MIYGDIRDLIIEAYNAVHPDRDVNELVVLLSTGGLIADLGWLDGIIPDPADAANLGLGAIKSLIKQLPELPKPVQERIADTIKWTAKNPKQAGDMAGLLEWSLRNYDSEVGQAIFNDVLKRGVHDPRVFEQAAEMGKWLGRDPDRFASLAQEAAEGGKIVHKSLNEAAVAMSLEELGPKILKPPVQRATDGTTDFVDNLNQKWDVKSFWSTPPGNGKGQFNLEKSIRKMETEFQKSGNNFIIDSRNLSDADLNNLKNAIDSGNYSFKVEWFPPT